MSDLKKLLLFVFTVRIHLEMNKGGDTILQLEMAPKANTDFSINNSCNFNPSMMPFCEYYPDMSYLVTGNI